MPGENRSGLCIFFLILMLSLICLTVTGCRGEEKTGSRDVEFTVCDDTKIPEELKEIIEEKKKEKFNLSYANNSYFYIAVGYGKVEQRELKITVNDLHVTDSALYVDTTLVTGDTDNADASSEALQAAEDGIYPYIVIKCEKFNLPVIFNTD